MTMTFASLETSGDACAGNYRQHSQSKDQFVKNEQHKSHTQDDVLVGIPTKIINQLEAPVSWVWGATCTAASFVAVVAVAAVATPCILAIGTAGTVAAVAMVLEKTADVLLWGKHPNKIDEHVVAKRLARQVADLADQRTAIMSADEEIASQSDRQQQYVLMLEESIQALNAELRVKDLQMTRVMEEHQMVVRELHVGVEAGISELRDAHETQLFLALEDSATASVQVEQMRQEMEVLKAHVLQVESDAFMYVSIITKEHGDAMMQIEAENNMLIQHVDSLNHQLSTFVALAQAYADEATDLRVNGVETMSCTLHALLVAVGAPLTQTLSVSSQCTLAPTESATSRGLILELVPCIVELLSSTGPWGQKLMQFCGVARVQALEEIINCEGSSLLRAARKGAWEEGQGTLYCQEEVLGDDQLKRTTTLVRLMIEQA
ncbi:hypothetical protein CEUSTIGMA_g11727.t1 [Chlamydomonas eustigma]|uniref:Uncharacterized protein n=1 Tax=Chlamydomonas eustigma TaxID=1157962 RepID=A0A250XMI4_9CHLO|nr:hypothetical protein CEUSTIGMA_g11727.t1 [Chlamydomonas eustigma]|eukprot:GAX84305.1 hypothetical protein CEUSTIGMA_g11727.t1 [Chlamydomonas eustigma]